MNKLYLGMGCFWSSQHIYKKYLPEKNTKVGYINEVEVIEIEYKEKEIDSILKIFFENHSFTIQDIPEKYSSYIFYENENDLQSIKFSLNHYIKQVKSSGRHGEVKTKINKVSNFILANEFNQNYLEKNNNISCNLGFNGVHY